MDYLAKKIQNPLGLVASALESYLEYQVLRHRCFISRYGLWSLGAGFTISFRLDAPIPVYVVFLVLWVGSVMALQMLPVVWRPTKFAVPLSPFTPALGMFVTLHLIGTPTAALPRSAPTPSVPSPHALSYYIR